MTSASGMVVSHRAVGIESTLARIDTPFILTGQRLVTVIINQTFIRGAFCVRVSLVIILAHTLGHVISGLAHGIDATVFKKTWVLALSVDASLRITTFKVAFAAG